MGAQGGVNALLAFWYSLFSGSFLRFTLLVDGRNHSWRESNRTAESPGDLLSTYVVTFGVGGQASTTATKRPGRFQLADNSPGDRPPQSRGWS